MFREIADRHPDTDYAPQAVYCAGVSKYKGGDASALPATARQLASRYGDTSWAKKSSVWLH